MGAWPNVAEGDIQTDHRNARARRVVTGLDKNGRSTIVSDELAVQRFVGDAFTVNMVWQAESVPVSVSADNSIQEITNVPPAAGFNYFITTFPPDSSWDLEAGYKKSLDEFDANESPEPNDDPSMHKTNTFDIITIISGEVWAVLETGETLLKAGDTIVQRGTKHTWRNRSNRDCVLVAFMASARG